MKTIRVQRKEETEKATFGELYVDDEKIGQTLEPPWRNNKISESCIPPGEYDAYIRSKETSRWDYDVIQLRDVFNRSAIQIHIGNYINDTKGCILIGKGRGKNAVWNSTDAYEELMSKLDEEEFKVIVEYA